MRNLKISLLMVLVVGLVIVNGIVPAVAGNWSLISRGQATVNAADLTGEEIMERVYNRDQGDDRQANTEMILINRHGDQRIREIKQFTKDFGEVEKKIMFFVSPRDVRGISFMNWSYDQQQNDDQWIYLPALRKVKRISSENKSDYFMGSDFTYDDLGDRKLDQDKHKLLRTEELEGEQCYVVESVPREEGYMYSRTVTWVIKDKWIGLKKEFYDPEGELLKILYNKKYEEVDNILTVMESEMHNVQTDHKTQMIISEVSYNSGLGEQKFTERMMRRGL